jgi:hypothetical protein
VIRAVVYVEEGRPVFVETVDVKLMGVPLDPAEERLLREHVPLERGDIFSQAEYERTAVYLRTYYREHGFARVRLSGAPRSTSAGGPPPSRTSSTAAPRRSSARCT